MPDVRVQADDRDQSDDRDQADDCDPADDSGQTDGVDVSVAPERSGRRRVAPLLVLVVALVMAGLFVVLIGAKSGDEAESNYTPLLGKPAPAVQTTTLDGQSFDLQRRKGSWVVLNFFDSTCVPCVQEHPALVEFARQQADRPDGAELYTVVFNNDRASNVSEFFAENDGFWPVLEDSTSEIQVSFGVAKVPETWVIDPSGVVVFRTIAKVTADSLTRALAELRASYAAPQ